MKMIIRLFLGMFLASAITITYAAEPPKVLGQYLEVDKPARGEVVTMSVPAEFNKFRAILTKAKKADPEWFKKLMSKAGKENPIPPYDAKLGITKEEYDKYVAIWNTRKYKKIEGGEVILKFTEEGKNEWIINVSGRGMPITLLKYISDKDEFKSSNGTLKRIGDIKSPKESVYRDWTGHEWRYFNDGDLVKTKENVAVGRTGDGRYGLLIYSLQELSGQGRLLADELLMIRFVPKKLKK